MNNIGICFPYNDFDKLEFSEFKDYLLQFIKSGITSFDFYTSLFLNYNKKLEELLLFLDQHNIKITFHYQSSNNIDLITSEENYEKLLYIYKEELLKVRTNLKKLNINYKTTIVFHGLNYLKESRKYNHEINLIKVFNKLCEYASSLNFDILIETLSYNHPSGKHIGDDIYELNDFINNINSNNFGICWDVGHTRLNNIENHSLIILPNEIIKKVKFTHIHNIHKDKNNEFYIDHLPLTNMEYQKEELKKLIKNNYQGIYSIEIDTNNLKENILIYLDSIKLLKETLEKLKEEII